MELSEGAILPLVVGELNWAESWNNGLSDPPPPREFVKELVLQCIAVSFELGTLGIRF
jgi:hypothetical protein